MPIYSDDIMWLVERRAGREYAQHLRDHYDAWQNPPAANVEAWNGLRPGYDRIIAKHPKLDRGSHLAHLGTLGTGNHFIEVCLDESEQVWFMLHSGSRGVGNRIGSYFIELARQDMRRWLINLPDVNLAYLPEGTDHFADYVEAVKGYASYLVNHSPEVETQFYWQAGYGALTFRKQELSTLVRYIQRQQEHHGGVSLWDEFERCED